MKKYSIIILAALLSALMMINITCKKDDDNDNPPDPEPPVYTDGQGEVGKIGGTVKIEDSGSPLDGCFVEIPEGALSSTKDISISLNTSNVLIIDSSAIIVEFAPEGLTFDEPINIGIPFPEGENSGNNLKVYYYEPDDEKLVEMPIIEYNIGDRIITFSTNHFSNFASTARFTDIFVDMVKVDGTIGALVEINSRYYGEERRLRNVYTLPLVAIETGFSNCRDLINLHNGQEILSVFNITLKRKIAFWADEIIQNKKMIVRRIENSTGSHGYKVYEEFVSQSNLLYEQDPGENELMLETFMQGIPLVFKFDKSGFELNSDHNYYINIEWAMATLESAIYASRYTHLYDENNRDEAKVPGDMIDWNFDVDPLDNIDDNYQEGGGGGGGNGCDGITEITYGGQIYNTVEIGNQCWLKENLNIGEMISGNQEMSNNQTIEKYCYGNNATKCQQYGGLYQWDEIMQYTNQEGSQGICPDGWHIPTDREWKILEGTVDSQYGINDPEWNNSGWRGYDAGKNIKDPDDWSDAGNNQFGLSMLHTGNRSSTYLNFHNLNDTGAYWSSTEDDSETSILRVIHNGHDGMSLSSNNKKEGYAIRCLKD